MTAINSAMEVDLTGQATAESLGGTFYSGTADRRTSCVSRAEPRWKDHLGPAIYGLE